MAVVRITSWDYNPALSSQVIDITGPVCVQFQYYIEVGAELQVMLLKEYQGVGYYPKAIWMSSDPTSDMTDVQVTVTDTGRMSLQFVGSYAISHAHDDNYNPAVYLSYASETEGACPYGKDMIQSWFKSGSLNFTVLKVPSNIHKLDAFNVWNIASRYLMQLEIALDATSKLLLKHLNSPFVGFELLSNYQTLKHKEILQGIQI